MNSDDINKLIFLFEIKISKIYFDNQAENNLYRIISSRFDKTAFLKYCLLYDHYIDILIQISNSSNYLSDILIKDPEYFYIIASEKIISKKLNENDFCEEIKSKLNNYKSINSKINFLKSIKRREVLITGIRDYLNFIPTEEVINELSIQAKTISSFLFELCYQQVLQKYNVTKIKSNYTLISLGKLGGRELNYSSDIDLIIFFDENTTYNKITFHEVLTEAIKLFIGYSSNADENGFLYRIDLRLRPGGRNAPLCASYMDYLHYYENKGEDWERQMLIKADYLAGNSDLYKSFINYLTPFIYPSNLFTSPAEQINKLKVNIESSLKEEDIKLIPGGIRDIEFSVQALQLLNGGKFKQLRTGNTLEALRELNNHNLITSKEYNNLREAYIFFRRIEHYLQLMNDRQTHTIPSEPLTHFKLALFLDFKSSGQFNVKLNKHKKAVINFYNSIFGTEKSLTTNNIIFKNKARTYNNLEYLKNGTGLLNRKEFDKTTIELFSKIEPQLINFIKDTIDPDEVLDNFVKLTKSISFTSIWYKELTDKKYFNKVLKVCSNSKYAINLCSLDENLMDILITRKVFEKENELSQFKIKEALFILTSQFAADIIKPLRFYNLLFKYLSDKVKLYFSNVLDEKDYILLALGSFGSKDQSLSSDIDFLFIINDNTSINDKNIVDYFSKLIAELKPFKVDLRLRPEGKSSQLLQNLSSFENYLEKRADVWELQSYTKASLISGSDFLFNKFVNLIKERIKKENSDIIKRKIFEMRKKLYPALSNQFNIKKSPGGLLDIDFIIQYLALFNYNNLKSIVNKSNLEKLNYFLKKLDEPFLTELKNNYIFLKELEIIYQSKYDKMNNNIEMNEEEIKYFANRFNFIFPEEFSNYFNSIISSNKKIFNNIK